MWCFIVLLLFGPLPLAYADAPVPAPKTETRTANEASNLAQPAWYWLGTIASEVSVRAPDPAVYTLNLAEGQVSIQADCNRGSGTYTRQNDLLTFGPIALTRRACQPGSQGEQYARQLQTARRVTERNGVLQLDLGNNAGTMLFARDPKARLYRYRCREGAGIDAIFASGRAYLWYGSQYYSLTQVPSGSGARYADDGTSFHTKGTLGALTIRNQIVARDCQMPSNAAP